jgi:hypothetical protein
VRVEEDDAGRAYVDGASVVTPIAADLEEARFYTCPLAGMGFHFPPLLDLYVATRGESGLTPASLGIDVLTPGAVDALAVIHQQVMAKEHEFRPKNQGDQ